MSWCLHSNASSAADFLMAWDHDTPDLIERYELISWVNNNKPSKSITTELPTEDKPFSVTEDVEFGDTFYAKVRACADINCSDWTETISHDVDESTTVIVSPPNGIRIIIKIKPIK